MKKIRISRNNIWIMNLKIINKYLIFTTENFYVHGKKDNYMYYVKKSKKNNLWYSSTLVEDKVDCELFGEMCENYNIKINGKNYRKNELNRCITNIKINKFLETESKTIIRKEKFKKILHN